MKICYIHDFCFLKNSDNKYTAVGMPEKYFDRFFLSGVLSVSIISRNKNKNLESIRRTGFDKIVNDNIKIPIELPGYFYLLLPSVFFSICREIRNSECLVINFPSIIGIYIWIINLFINKQYILEVAADETQFDTKKFGFIIKALLIKIFPVASKKASGIITVSNYLRNKYPNNNSVVASNVYIKHISKKKVLKFSLSEKEVVTLTFVGGVNKRKGVDTLIKAIKMLSDEGISNIKLNIVGGHFDDSYIDICKSLSINEIVTFHGLLKPEQVESILNLTDLYIQPSVAEGIPRASLEAMAKSLPIIATDLPGFREILPKESIVPVSNVAKLANKIKLFLHDVDICNYVIEHNLNLIQDFREENLNKIRIDFFKKTFGAVNERL
ncbi:glycosyltransferase family 4 protein [Vibrio breoganii]|uniref:glycosyltransferase family 4 protein n=1 Tax=Vibrio breoganii TaxID=553239 RepID=UPI000C85B551|nr:glycosyltransferase family 4 protein [Vibrio breoganii]PMJ45291.1 hypothetical protein BCU21_13880 [Vibrio breoganii]